LLDDITAKLMIANFQQIPATNLNNLIVGGGSNFAHATIFCVDLSSMSDPADDIIKAFASFKKMYDCKIVIIADRAPPNSPILSRLFVLGIYNIVVNLDDDSLKKALTGDFTRKEAELLLKNGQPDIPETNIVSFSDNKKEDVELEIIDKITANRDFKKRKPFIAVGICGTQEHIGVTHFALLTAKFLCNIGFRTCYLEAHKRRNIVYLDGTYNVNANKDKNLLQFEGVDMFFDFKLPRVIAENYDFYIFDFGRFDETELTAFFTQDIKLIIGGTKAWELPNYSAILENIGGVRDIRFIMTHAPPNEFNNIRKAMENFRVYFFEYAPYPFATGVNLDIYKDIFNEYLTVDTVVKPVSESKSKKGLFKIFRS